MRANPMKRIISGSYKASTYLSAIFNDFVLRNIEEAGYNTKYRET
jgi:hypothetical protein